MFKPVEPHPKFAEKEGEILDFWEKKDIFQKTLRKNEGKENFVFFEGPPTANGRPGLHHIIARAFKDAVSRYQTMRGRYVRRKAGWDTHGLPVELEVEKSLGISGKGEIENLKSGDKRGSIEKFNKLCRESVWKYKDEWEQFTKRMGHWLDLSDPYITYENSYIESVWWVLKQISEKKIGKKPLLYQGHKVVPYCPRCGTAVSSHEVAQGYERVTETSIYIKFLVEHDKLEVSTAKGQPEVVELDRPTYIVSWTTTPWTLPGNVALAVGEEIEYALVSVKSEYYIVAVQLLEKVLGAGGFTVIEKFRGRYLKGLKYKPLFQVSELSSETSHKVYTAGFVNTEEGTGIVHTAVMYGEDDYQLGTDISLPKFHTVDEEGKFIKTLSGLSGMYVKDHKTEEKIVSFLKKNKNYLREEQYTHDYPFCWRCKTPLLYYARNSWFIRMSELKERLMSNNSQINWVPEYIKEGRFGGWLSEIKDWAISRERYWGTPLPFWHCLSCEHVTTIGSIEELQDKAVSGKEKKAAKTRLEKLDLHRPYVDEIKIKCEKCGEEAERVSEVLDVWFDSGAMPYAQWHYPFENQNVFKSQYPADYISEAIDQTRGWFYTLLAIATALGGEIPPYKNVINLGHVLDENGQKMSKSKGNIVEPMVMAEKYGFDIMRWYMYTVNQPGDSKRFSETDLTTMQRKVQIIFWNVYNYFVTYANASKWEYDDDVSPKAVKGSTDVLDQWITLKLQDLINQVTQSLDSYNIFRAVRLQEAFINDFSTWYLRRSRGRTDEAFFATLYRTLIYSIKLMAPFMPFFAETVYQNLRAKGYPESIHLDSWPQAQALEEDQCKQLEEMENVRNIVEAALAWRKSAGIKVRQPLADLIVMADEAAYGKYTSIIADELNMTEVSFNLSGDVSSYGHIPAVSGKHPEIYINKEISAELAAQGLAREIERAVQVLRKNSGLKVGQMVEFYYETGSPEVYNALEYFDQAKTYVNKIVGSRTNTSISQELKINGYAVWIGLK